jgi:preprotein translocase subunit YajC
VKYLPLIIVLAVILVLLVVSGRARRRQAENAAKQAAVITVGSEVMTTSGLYGTVVARNDDESVQLSIAPGVEVKWALAALREVEGLPDRYRPGGDAADADAPPGVPLDKPSAPPGDGAARPD